MSYLNIPTSLLADGRILVYRQPSEVPVVTVTFPVVVVVQAVRGKWEEVVEKAETFN
jgi:hypothetical protein